MAEEGGGDAGVKQATLKLTYCYLEFQILPQAAGKDEREQERERENSALCLSGGDN